MRTILLAVLLGSALTVAGAARQGSIIVHAEGGNVHALAGDVTDPSGATIPNVVVERMASDGKTVAETTKTDAQGHFSLTTANGDGRYTLEFEAPGFASLELAVSVNHRLHRMIHATMTMGM